jgi:glutathione S-transferase
MAARVWRATRAFAGRWREVGQPYEVRPVSFKAMKEPSHLALHPFGQIPTYEDGETPVADEARPAAFRDLNAKSG